MPGRHAPQALSKGEELAGLKQLVASITAGKFHKNAPSFFRQGYEELLCHVAGELCSLSNES
jgi:hypothetical protein